MAQGSTSKRKWISPHEKPFKCPTAGCAKSYSNFNGLKYHIAHGTCKASLTSAAGVQDPSVVLAVNPFACWDQEQCGRTYKNMNGLRYHYLHSGDHGKKGMDMLQASNHPNLGPRSLRGSKAQWTQKHAEQESHVYSESGSDSLESELEQAEAELNDEERMPSTASSRRSTIGGYPPHYQYANSRKREMSDSEDEPRKRLVIQLARPNGRLQESSLRTFGDDGRSSQYHSEAEVDSPFVPTPLYTGTPQPHPPSSTFEAKIDAALLQAVNSLPPSGLPSEPADYSSRTNSPIHTNHRQGQVHNTQYQNESTVQYEGYTPQLYPMSQDQAFPYFVPPVVASEELSPTSMARQASHPAYQQQQQYQQAYPSFAGYPEVVQQPHPHHPLPHNGQLPPHIDQFLPPGIRQELQFPAYAQNPTQTQTPMPQYSAPQAPSSMRTSGGVAPSPAAEQQLQNPSYNYATLRYRPMQQRRAST